MSEYREVLHRWAASVVPEATEVVSVQMHFNEGYNYSSVAYDDASFSATIGYKDSAGTIQSKWFDHDVLPSMSELLQELFKLAEAE